MNEIAAEIERAIRYAADPESMDAFHAKMMEDPDAHLPHLVFADYLEENGNPGAAEIIRRAADGGKGAARTLSYRGMPKSGLELRVESPGHFTKRNKFKEAGHTILYLDHTGATPESGTRTFTHKITLPTEEATALIHGIADDVQGAKTFKKWYPLPK